MITDTPGKRVEVSTVGGDWDEWVDGVHRELTAVLSERIHQVQKYGTNAHTPDGNGPETCWLLPTTVLNATLIEEDLRDDYQDYEEQHGHVTWVHLLREEVAEAFKEDDGRKLYDELIQIAALAVSQAQQLRARGYELLYAHEED